MISFVKLEKSGEEISKKLGVKEDGASCEIAEIADSFLPFANEGADFGFAFYEDFLLVRIYDGGEYAFVYPIPLAEGKNEENALEELRKYAVKEEIPLVFCDVPRECLETVENFFRYTESFFDEEGECYTVKVLTELSRYPDEIFLTDGVIELSPLCEADIADYSRLAKDVELNKYWGYDYREDEADPDDFWFYKAAVVAKEEGVALSLGARRNGRLVGEGCIWGFDLLGSAEIGFRILPEHQGQGFGKRTLNLLLSLGEELGLSELRASVMKENSVSIKIVEKIMKPCVSINNVNKYSHKY